MTTIEKEEWKEDARTISDLDEKEYEMYPFLIEEKEAFYDPDRKVFCCEMTGAVLMSLAEAKAENISLF